MDEMNEQPDAPENPAGPAIPMGPAHNEGVPATDRAAAPIRPDGAPSADDPAPTRQHPLTQPVPHVQPADPGRRHPSYPGQPAPVGTWAPMPAPGTWGAAEAPVLGPVRSRPCPGTRWMGCRDRRCAPPDRLAAVALRLLPRAAPAGGQGPQPKGQLAVVASLVAVLALLLGAGIGHATWPTATTSATATSPSTGNGSGSGGSNFPFGSGSGTGGWIGLRLGRGLDHRRRRTRRTSRASPPRSRRHWSTSTPT